MKKYKFAVYIGRFQPFHNGHLEVIKRGYELAENVIVLVGSASAAPDIRNPFNAVDRAQMIVDSIYDSGLKPGPHLWIDFLDDHFNSDTDWLAQVHKLVASHSNDSDSVCLLGSKKDATSYYLDLFDWPKELSDFTQINATDIRNQLFDVSRDGIEIQSMVSPSVLNYINEFVETDEFDRLSDEWHEVKNYAYGPGPHLTVDACVTCRGHILMIKRGKAPGEGQWALPGGFLNKGERLRDACVRELREETGLKVPLPVLYGSIRAEQVFDHPLRDRRARIITQGFLIVLNNEKTLPKVKGGDDAAAAKWVKWAKIKPEETYADHYQMIKALLGKEQK